VNKTPASGSNNAWQTSHGGRYTITLDTAKSTVAFSSTKQVITITGGPSALAPEESAAFTYTTTIADPVTWNVYGDNQDHTNALQSNGTGIVDGILTLGGIEWIGHTLYVTATSLGETVQNTLAVPVIDAKVWYVGDNEEASWKNDPGLEMSRTIGTPLFTRTVTIKGERKFRFAYDNNTNSDNWVRLWLIPPRTDGSNQLYWIGNDQLSTLLGVTRYENAGSDNGCSWFLPDASNSGPGEGTYTLTYDAAAKTLTVTK
jgi:hypothetical protein